MASLLFCQLFSPGSRAAPKHLFEHLRFNESQNIPQGQWFKRLQTAGASTINGSTNTDLTNYFEVVPKNAIEMALYMESDRMGFLLSKFTQETFVTQQNVVQNEKRQYDNNPYSQTSYIMDKMMYPENHPYNWQVIGSLEDLANASIEDAVKFHNGLFKPDMILIEKRASGIQLVQELKRMRLPVKAWRPPGKPGAKGKIPRAHAFAHIHE